MGRNEKYSWILAGSLVVAAGFTLVGHFAFKGNVLMVSAGYALFVLGYKACWLGSHFREVEGLQEFASGLGFLREIVYEPRAGWLMAVGGVFAVAFGSIKFAEASTTFETASLLYGGVFVYGGYVVAHEGVNQVPL